MRFLKRFLVVFGLVALMLLLTGASDRSSIADDRLEEFITWYAILYTAAGIATFAGAINDARNSGFFSAIALWTLVVVAVTAAVSLIYAQRGFDSTTTDLLVDFVALATPVFFGSLFGTMLRHSDEIPLPEALAERVRRHDEAVNQKQKPPAGWRTPER